MKLLIPILPEDNPYLTQIFGDSRIAYMKDFPDMIYGHNGLDYVASGKTKCGYGTKILASHDWESCTLESDFPNKKRGNGIYLRHTLETPIIINGILASSIETCYWHLADFEISSGQKGKAGEVIGLMGNAGYVYPKPTPNQPWNGTHLHFGVRFYHSSGNIIPSSFSGNYVDPLPFLYNKGQRIGTGAYLGKNLSPVSYEDDVSKLQSLLTLEGLFIGEPTGQYGPKTIASVIAFQKRNGLSAVGVVGPATRNLLNNIYA